MTRLRDRNCVPCRGGAPALSLAAARARLGEVPGWALELGPPPRLTKRFAFEAFPAAIAWVNRLAELAEAQGHHPDLNVRYRWVEVAYTTHAIQGLHDNDFVMAAKTDAAYDGFPGARGA